MTTPTTQRSNWPIRGTVDYNNNIFKGSMTFYYLFVRTKSGSRSGCPLQFLPVFKEGGQLLLDAAVWVFGYLGLFEVQALEDEDQFQLFLFYFNFIENSLSFLEVGLNEIVFLPRLLLNRCHFHLDFIGFLLDLNKFGVKGNFPFLLILIPLLQFQEFIVDVV